MVAVVGSKDEGVELKIDGDIGLIESVVDKFELSEMGEGDWKTREGKTVEEGFEEILESFVEGKREFAGR